VKTPANDSLSALTSALRLAWTSAPHWILPVVVLAIIGALPEAWMRYSARSLYAQFTGGGGVDLLAVQSLGMAALVGLLFSLTAQLVAVAWAFLVMSEVAAGRPPGIREGLRRTLAWRLQLSWLVSAFLVSTAHRLWFIGGCFLLVPFGLAVSDAYEAGSGMGALGRANRLGFSVGPSGGKLGVPMAIASTGLLLAIAVLDTLRSTATAYLSPALDLTAAAELVTTWAADPTSGGDLLGGLVMALLPEPSLTGVALALVQSPWPILTQILVLAVPIVAYHDAVRIDGTREKPILADTPA
jgi:hypothetical protein